MKANKIGVALGIAGIVLTLVAGVLSSISSQKMMEYEVQQQVAKALNLN